MTELFTPAKRGDLVLVKGYSSSLSLRDGYSRREHWTFAEVTNVTRDGRVKGYRAYGQERVSKGIPADCVVCPQSKLRGRNAASVLADLPQEYPGQGPWPKEFPSVADARAALLAVLGE